MAVRFFAVAVASIGLVTDVFAAEPPKVMPAPAPMPATVMTQATPMQVVRTGRFGRRTVMMPMTNNMVMPAGYTMTAGTVMAARADAPVTGQATPPKTMAGTSAAVPATPMTSATPVVTGTMPATVSTTPVTTTPSRPRLFSRLFSRR